MSKSDRDKIMAERRRKGVKLGKGEKGGSYTYGNNKALKTLRQQYKKFKRQIKSLKRTDGGNYDDSGNDDGNSNPGDAGDAFGGRNKNKAMNKS